MNGKFKVGDRVKVVYPGRDSTGYIGLITNISHNIELDNGTTWGMESSLELVTSTYQKLTPKVGDKFRVVKDMQGDNHGDNGPRKGSLIEVIHKDDSNRSIKVEGGNWLWNKELTTEYLEPVKSEEPTLGVWWGLDTTYESAGSTINVQGITELERFSEYPAKQEPIKKSITQKTMSFIKRLTQSAEDKTLAKANFTDSCGELTSAGQQALISLVFAEKKAELVKLAEEVIAESKE